MVSSRLRAMKQERRYGVGVKGKRPSGGYWIWSEGRERDFNVRVICSSVSILNADSTVDSDEQFYICVAVCMQLALDACRLKSDERTP